MHHWVKRLCKVTPSRTRTGNPTTGIRQEDFYSFTYSAKLYNNLFIKSQQTKNKRRAGSTKTLANIFDLVEQIISS